MSRLAWEEVIGPDYPTYSAEEGNLLLTVQQKGPFQYLGWEWLIGRGDYDEPGWQQGILAEGEGTTVQQCIDAAEAASLNLAKQAQGVPEARKCDSCGNQLPAGVRRRRVGETMLCPGCVKGRPGMDLRWHHQGMKTAEEFDYTPMRERADAMNEALRAFVGPKKNWTWDELRSSATRYFARFGGEVDQGDEGTVTIHANYLGTYTVSINSRGYRGPTTFSDEATTPEEAVRQGDKAYKAAGTNRTAGYCVSCHAIKTVRVASAQEGVAQVGICSECEPDKRMSSKTADQDYDSGWSDASTSPLVRALRKRPGWVITSENDGVLQAGGITGFVRLDYKGEVRTDLEHSGQRITLGNTGGYYSSVGSAITAVERYVAKYSTMPTDPPAERYYAGDDAPRRWLERPLATKRTGEFSIDSLERPIAMVPAFRVEALERVAYGPDDADADTMKGIIGDHRSGEHRDEPHGGCPLCDALAQGRDTSVWGPTKHGKVAHDSGDNIVIAHCVWCGSGQVVGRSDGTVWCDFCKRAFTVQAQPEMANMPQTVDGQPNKIPGMNDPAPPTPGAPPSPENPGGPPPMPQPGGDKPGGDKAPPFGKKPGGDKPPADKPKGGGGKPPWLSRRDALVDVWAETRSI